MFVKKRDRTLIVKQNILDPLRETTSGKTMLVATSGGPRRTAVRIDGNPVFVILNAYIRRNSCGKKIAAERKKTKKAL